MAATALSSWLRAATGARPRVLRALRRTRGSQPPSPELTLYEYETSPFCRRVREVLTMLDLSATVKPCPRSTLLREGAVDPKHRWRSEAAKVAGERPLRFPLLVDSGEPVFGSKAIVLHLWERHGCNVEGTEELTRERVESWAVRTEARFDALADIAPFDLRAGRLGNVSRWLTDEDIPRLTVYSILRPIGGTFLKVGAGDGCARGTRSGADPRVELWGFEDCAVSRAYREMLCAYQVAYVSRPCAPGSANLGELARHGFGQDCVPLLRIDGEWVDDRLHGGIGALEPLIADLRD